jgi:hypothetical protein
VEMFKERSKVQEKFKGSKKFNLGTIFQMKNHSIAFEVSHFSSHECSEKSVDWRRCSKNVQKVQGKFKGSKKFNLGTIFQMKNHSIASEVSHFTSYECSEKSLD